MTATRFVSCLCLTLLLSFTTLSCTAATKPPAATTDALSPAAAPVTATEGADTYPAPPVHMTPSVFANALTGVMYPAAPTPENYSLSWDFSAPGQYIYDQQQSINLTSVMTTAGESSTTRQKATVTAALIINSNADATADMTLSNINMNLSAYLNDATSSTTLEQELPDQYMPGLSEHGVPAAGGDFSNQLFRFLFPLPAAEYASSMRVGDSLERTGTLPFRPIQTQLMVSGLQRITLSRFVLIGDILCARLDVETLVADLQIPPGLQEKVEFAFQENSVYYFDIQARRFLSGTTVMVMKTRVEVPPAAAPAASENATPTTLSMNSDTLLTMTLRQ